MVTMNIFFVIGVCIIYSAFVLAPPPPGYVKSENLEECQLKSDDLMEVFVNCVKTEFSEDQLNETRRIYNNTRCVQCKHLCRKQPQVMECIRTGVEIMINISNKSKYMVPFFGKLSEIILKAYCDYDKVESEVDNEEDRQCFLTRWNACNSHIQFIGFPEVVAFCDSGNPETDPYTMEFICQKIDDFMQCAQDGAVECSANAAGIISHLKYKLRTSESCAH